MSDRWLGRTALDRLFWLELLGYGSVINLAFGFAGLLLLAHRVAITWSLTLHALVWPANLFLVACVWRHPRARTGHRVVAALWLAFMLVI